MLYAGIQHVSTVQDFTSDAFNKVIAINLAGVFHTTRLALPAMQKRNWGKLLKLGT
jgi:3-hydroxybutyrate dehydrogenase